MRDNFFDLGGHSLLAVRLMARIEERFGRRLPLSTFLLGATIEDLANELREPADVKAWSPLVEIEPGGSGDPLYLVHPVGGTILCLAGALAQRLLRRPCVFGLHSAGLDGGGNPETSIEGMAARYLTAVRSQQPSGPYRLGGWSMGGVVASEMARQLREQGEQVDAPSSSAPAGSNSVSDADLLAAFALDLALRLRPRPAVRSEGPASLGHRLGTMDALDALGLEGDLLDEIWSERLGRHWSLPRANARALAAYGPKPLQERLTLQAGYRGKKGPAGRDARVARLHRVESRSTPCQATTTRCFRVRTANRSPD